MRESIDSLEVLKSINDELQENHICYERELVEEIEFKDTLLEEFLKRNVSQQELILDNEQTMNKFRETVSNLSSELDSLKAPLISDDYMEDGGEDSAQRQRQMVVSANLQLQNSELEVRRLGKELKLKNLQLSYYNELSEILKVCHYCFCLTVFYSHTFRIISSTKNQSRSCCSLKSRRFWGSRKFALDLLAYSRRSSLDTISISLSNASWQRFAIIY